MSEILSYLSIGLHVRCPLFLSDFIGTWIFSTDFRKYPDIRFVENPSIWSRVIPCGRTDRHDEANSHFSQFCERVQKALSSNELISVCYVAKEVRTLCECAAILTHWGRVTQICVNTRLFSLHSTLNYAIHRACLRMVLLTDVYRNLTSLWINL